MKSKEWQEIKDVFAAAFDLSEDARAAFLKECREDLRLEVEKLFAANDEAKDFIAEPALVEMGVIDARHTDPYIGKQIDSYKILSEIGQGGMGTVYLASRADESFDKKVAVKLIKRGMDTNAVLKRFVMERQILANLENPFIATLLDGGSTTDGLPYLVMEYVEGEPITKFCDSHRFSTEERLELFQKVCSAISYAHQNLVVHRDIKPSNILVTKDGTPKLLDFGIAKLLHPDWSLDTREATATMFRVMTPEYASPEQIRGLPITTASDVYSLGVVLYELLTGERPYKIESRWPEEVAQIVLTAEPLKPSECGMRNTERELAEKPTLTRENLELKTDEQTKFRIPHSTFRNLKGDLDNIILKALRKESERRYASVQEFSEDIRRHLQGLPVKATADTLSYRVVKFVQRHRAGVFAAALIGLFLLLTTTFAAWQAVRANAERANAQQRFDEVRALANSLMFEVHDSIKDLSGATPARQLIVKRALEYLDKLAQESENDMTLQAELAAGYERIGDVQGNPFYANLGDTTGALESYRKALAIREILNAETSLSSAEKFTFAMLHGKISQVTLARNDLHDAETHCRQALEIVEKLVGAEPGTLQYQVMSANLYLHLGDIIISKKDGDANSAMGNYRKSIAAVESVSPWAAASEIPSDGPPLNEKMLGTIQMAYRRIGQRLESTLQTDEAFEAYLKALDASEKLLVSNPKKAQYKVILAISLGNAGRTQATLGNFDDAFANIRRMVQISENVVLEDPQNALAVSQLSLAFASLGYVSRQSGDFRNALVNLHKSFDIQKKIREKDPNDVYNAGNLGETIAAIGAVHEKMATEQKKSSSAKKDQLIEAEKWYQRSLEIWLELKQNDKLPQYYSGKIDEQKQAIDRCRSGRS